MDQNLHLVATNLLHQKDGSDQKSFFDIANLGGNCFQELFEKTEYLLKKQSTTYVDQVELFYVLLFLWARQTNKYPATSCLNIITSI
mgnify:FL=1